MVQRGAQGRPRAAQGRPGLPKGAPGEPQPGGNNYTYKLMSVFLPRGDLSIDLKN